MSEGPKLTLDSFFWVSGNASCRTNQGFMQDQIIASHTTHVLVDTWMLTVKSVDKL